MIPLTTQDEITARQQALRCPTWAQTASEKRTTAAWWELEAERGYPSAALALGFAASLRRQADTMEGGP